VFGSGQGVCGNTGIMYKYMVPGTNTWVAGPQMYGGCGAEQQPDWIPGEVGRPLQDFDAPEVLYSETAVFPTPNYEDSGDASDLRKWVMYYSVYLNTPDVEDADEEIGQGCIGRATATGPPDNLVWTEDGKPVFCSNINFDSNQYPITKRYDSEVDYIENVGAMDFAIDPALVKDSQTGNYIMSWGSGAIHAVPIDPLTGHLVESAMSSNCNGPCKDSPDDEDSNFDTYTVLSLGGENFNEAPFILEQRNNNNINYHYLFVNWWGCCSGKCSSYEIRVGRSTTGVLGPYKDKNGLRMDQEEKQTIWGSDNHSGGSVFLQGEGRYIGPGHSDVFRYTKEGTTSETLVFTFHWYDNLENGLAKLAARELTFDADDWPVVASTPWDVCEFTGCSPPVDCVNNRMYKYQGNGKKRCHWIMKNEARRTKLCKKAAVLSACAMTCGVCCADDPTFKFVFNNKNKNCAWLSKQKKARKNNRCKKQAKIRSNCPIACANCFDPPANMFAS